MSEEKYFNINLKVPRAWMPIIEEVVKESGMERTEWLRAVIRDALKESGKWPPKNSCGVGKLDEEV